MQNNIAFVKNVKTKPQQIKEQKAPHAGKQWARTDKRKFAQNQ